MSPRGYTLLELLVVVVIIGIVAGAVSLSIAPAESRRMQEEVDRLAALFRLANDEARISGSAISWRADADGYRFMQSGAVRGELGGDDPLRPRPWPFEVRSVSVSEIVFGREPLMEPTTIRISTATQQLAIGVDAFGEVAKLP